MPIRDRLCTRIGIADDQEHNFSTFLMEMKEVAFICRNAGPKSLVLIDELGRATSNEDGVAIAWAVSEYLRTKGTSTFFVTHYPQLTKLADVYPGVWNQHMGASLAKNGGGVLYSHTIQDGPCQMSSDYGVEIAVTCGWPREVVEAAKEIRADIEGILPDCTAPILASAKESDDKRWSHRALLQLGNQLKEVSNTGDPTFRCQLEALRENIMTQGGMGAMSSLRSSLEQSLVNGRGFSGLQARGGVDRQVAGSSLDMACQSARVCDSSLSTSSSSSSL